MSDQPPAAVPLPPLRLGFAGFWDGFDPHDNFFTRLLSRRWRVEVCPDPEFLVHSCIGRRRHDHLRHDCIRIFYTGENVAADWLATDWAFTFEHTAHPRHFRLPHWPFYVDPPTLVKPAHHDPAAAAAAARQRRFCAFVVSNPLCRERNEFFRRLSRYAPVDSGGRLFNTVGGPVADKRAFLAAHRFTIAFENESHPGYTTEKLAEAMAAGSIPIYWGDPLVGRDFDTRSFLSAHDTPGPRWLDDLVERVVAIDRDPNLLQEMLGHPWYRNNRVPACADEERILDQFARIVGTPIEPVARRRGVARRLRLDRLPDALTSIRQRLKRKWRQFRCNA